MSDALHTATLTDILQASGIQLAPTNPLQGSLLWKGRPVSEYKLAATDTSARIQFSVGERESKVMWYILLRFDAFTGNYSYSMGTPSPAGMVESSPVTRNDLEQLIREAILPALERELEVVGSRGNSLDAARVSQAHTLETLRSVRDDVLFLENADRHRGFADILFSLHNQMLSAGARSARGDIATKPPVARYSSSLNGGRLSFQLGLREGMIDVVIVASRGVATAADEFCMVPDKPSTLAAYMAEQGEKVMRAAFDQSRPLWES